jgi:Asp-tRNA(Asn)/Glu-tRNA(Gln) amidotransferase A subunit family amidase
MNLRYLPEHAENALLALDLARKEAEHLHYTHRTLCAQTIDKNWVQQLESRDDLAEKVDAFVSRFGRLQAHLGEKLIPRFAALLGEAPKSMLDVLAYAERMQWIESAEVFMGTRKLRNLLAHEYMSDAELFLQSLLTARDSALMLFAIVSAIDAQATAIALKS